MKKDKILATTNTIIPIIFFLILVFTTDLDDKLLSIFMLTLFIGFIMPYLTILITGICLINNTHHKLSLILNILNILLSLIFIYLFIRVIDKNLIIILTEYSIMVIISIININHFIRYIKNHPNLENTDIKEKKKNNNGAIV